MNAEELKREKARNLRYRKPIARDLNLWRIHEELEDIGCACDDVQYFIDNDEETLINALDGDEDDAYEFKTMFADLAAECEQMQEDLRDEYLPEYFDIFFASMERKGELLGYDYYEGDYMGLDAYEAKLANKEATKKLKALTKDQLIEAAAICFSVYQAYIGLQYRYDCIKAAMDILRNENTGFLKMIKNINTLYDKADDETDGFRYKCSGGDAYRELDNFLKKLPQEAWIQ